MVYLDRDQRYLDDTIIAYGSAACIPVRLRDVFARALKVGASGILVAHNHPSGVAEPSSTDLVLTKQLKEALALLDITVLDHFVVSQGTTVSLAARGLL